MNKTRALAVVFTMTWLVVLVLAPQVRPAGDVEFVGDTYAAIAYSPSTGKFGYAHNFGSRADAERAALQKCKALDRRIVTWVNNGFCALALGEDKSCYGVGWSYGKGATNTIAKRGALEKCGKQTTGAHIVVCVCSINVER